MSSTYNGKLILTGEHSVVYGHRAILASLNIGINCQIESGCLTQEQLADQYLQKILQIFSKLLRIDRFDIDIRIESNLPIKSGLGSSAAYAAAVFAELAKFYEYSLSQIELYELVLEAENYIHGRSSGADPAIVVYGGLISFCKGQVEQLTTGVLSEKIFFLIDSGAASESTGEMVKEVAELKQRSVILDKIGLISEQIYADLKNDIFNPQLISQNQALLEQLGVVSDQAKKMINQLQKNGAFCKITGAGGAKTGSGYILAFHQNSEKLRQVLERLDYKFFETQLGIENEKN